MKKKVYKVLKEKYNYDLDSEWFTDEMICVIDDTIKATVEILTPKTKPLEERKAIFKSKLSDKLGKYGVEIIEEFFDYWTEHNEKGRVMKFEKQKTFNIDLRLKQWYKRSAQYQTKSKGVNQAWQ